MILPRSAYVCPECSGCVELCEVDDATMAAGGEASGETVAELLADIVPTWLPATNEEEEANKKSYFSVR